MNALPQGASTAERIAATAPKFQAYTLSGGYGMSLDGSRECWDPCRVVTERRNATGRCTYLLGEYADGSRLEFHWHPVRGISLRVRP